MMRVYHSAVSSVVNSLSSLTQRSRVSRHKYRIRARASAWAQRSSRRAICVALAISLLINSTPAAAQTTVNVFAESQASLGFWLRANRYPERLWQTVSGQRTKPKPQETQEEREARISRIEIYPGTATVDMGEKVRCAVVAYGPDDTPVGGVKIKWSAQDSASGRRARISPQGEFEALAPGSFNIVAEGAGRTASVSFVVRPGVKRNLSLAPSMTRQVSTRDLPTKTDNPKDSQGEKVAQQSKTGRSKAKVRGSALRAHSNRSKLARVGPSLPAPAMPLLDDGEGWDDTNYWSADDPGNGVGNPPGSPLDQGAGSGNFQFAAPVLGLPGRGIDVSLGLAYNSRLWNKAGTQITYDIDRGWPAPGFSLGFGKLLHMGVNNGGMIVDADGTRHSFTGELNVYPGWGSTFSGHTTDGTFIDYTYTATNAVGITNAWVKLANGTIVSYGAPGAGAVYPTYVLDPNGNYIVITYVNNAGPRIQTITDTLNRAINFHYDGNQLLTAITGPGIDGGVRTLLRLHYSQLSLNYSFSGTLTPVVREANPFVIDALYYPATNTGYWFEDSYSTYGMLAKVSERRNMTFSSSSLNEQGTITSAGDMTKEDVYSYPRTIGDPGGSGLNDAPTYPSLTERWTRDGVNTDEAVTLYSAEPEGNPRTSTMIMPNGTKSIQYSYNSPGSFLDGLVYRDETLSGTTVLQSSNVTWAQGNYESPRPTRVEATDERLQTTATEFSYGTNLYNQITELRNYDYGGATLMSVTRTQFQNSSIYIWRHVFSLPLVVEVFAADGVTRLSRTDYQYDGQTLTARPNIGHHEQSFNPYAADEGFCYWEPDWSDPDCQGWCNPELMGCDGYCPQVYNCPYDGSMDYRGNVTQITTYADAVNLTGAVTETRRYDIAGNVVTASTSCCEQTSYTYTAATDFAYLQSQTRGSATDPFAQVTTSSTYDFNTGLTLSTTDADGRTAQTSYSAQTLRPQTVTLASGAHTDFAYDDNGMTVSETTYLESHPTHTTISHQSTRFLNGRAQLRQERALGASGAVDIVDTIYDDMGQTSQHSRPYRSGDAPQLNTFTYDALGRIISIQTPDGSLTQSFYNESSRPSVASGAAGETMRGVDAWGRERWTRTDAEGRVVEVVEPDPSGSGSVATNGLVTTYAYNVLGDLTTVTQDTQTRSFKYDALGRMIAQRLSEKNATLNDAGTFVGSGTWSDVFTHDDRSNLASHTDARGVKTVYGYNNDPLNRLQSVSYDTSGFGDTANPILPAATVTYQYRQKSSGPQLLDITDLSSITTTGVSVESYGYDTEGRASNRTLTLTSRPSYPFVTDYIFDSLDRIVDVQYPAEYGNGTQLRKVAHHDYDVASRVTGVTVNGASHASQTVYNAASQTTSLKVGLSGANQMTESYNYEQASGLLWGQSLVRGGDTIHPILDLTYQYTDANNKRTGQLTKILNHKNRNKDRGYTYDALGRLKVATGGQSGALWSQTYSYDRFGNRTSVSSSGNSASLRERGNSPNFAKAAPSVADVVAASTSVSAGLSAPSDAEMAPTQANAAIAKSTEQPSTNLSAEFQATPPSANILAQIEAPASDALGNQSPRSTARSHHASRSARSTPATPQSGSPTFTDDPLNVPQPTTIKALHITELRTWIDQLRIRAGLTVASWQQPVSVGSPIIAAAVQELRTKLDDALLALQLTTGGYSAGLAQNLPVLAVHIQELRDRVKAAWNSSSTIPRDGLAAVAYDTSSNRITTAGFDYDKDGNQVRALAAGGGAQRFQYDAAGRLVKVKTDANVTIVTYSYGPDSSRLIAQEGTESSNYRTYYATQGNAVIAEYSESPASPSAPQWSKSYVYLNSRLLSTLTPNGSGGAAVQYHHPDRLGTRVVSNAQDTNYFEQVTLPFGTALNSESSGTTNPRFTSYDRSASTGLDYAVNRHYDPQQGRFTQADPIGAGAANITDPQSWNMYTYVGNDPINQTDPTGLFFKKFFKWLSKALKWIALAAMVASLVISVVGMVVGAAALKAFLTTTLMGKVLAFVANIPSLIGNFIAGIPKAIAGIFHFAERGTAIVAGIIGNSVLLGASTAAGVLSEHLAAQEETGKGRVRREKAERRRARERARRLPPVRLPPDLPEIKTEPQQGKAEAKVRPKPELPKIDPEQPKLPDNATRGQKIRFALSKALRIWGGLIITRTRIVMMDPEAIQDVACQENRNSQMCWYGPFPGCCRYRGPML